MKPIAHDPTAERAVLGSCLLRPAAFFELAGYLAPDDFVSPSHVKIWEAMAALGDRLDVVTLAAELRRANGGLQFLDGGEVYLMALPDAVATAENATHYAKLVKSASAARRIVATCMVAADEASGEEGPEAALATLRTALDAIEAGTAPSATVRLGDVQERVQVELEQRWEAPDTWLVRTGIDGLDRIIGGFKPEQQVVVASNPGEGKSSFVWSTMIRAALRGIPCLIFSLEMSVFELVTRAWAFHASATDLGHEKPNGETWKRIMSAVRDLRGCPLFLNDKASTLGQIESEARIWRRKHPGVAVVATDYAGLVQNRERGRNREQEISGISAAGKRLAKSLKVAHVLVSQLNRENTKTIDGEIRRPKKSDMRDSGQLEADADVIILPWQHTKERDDDGEPTVFDNYLIVDKNRDGQCGAARVRFDRARFGFFDVENHTEASFHDAR